jgi:uncharacterized protein (TIGR03435 family)
MRIRCGAVFLVVNICAFAQPGPLAFEVASVKPAPPSDPHRISVRMSTDKGRIAYSNVNLRNVIMQAYKVKDSQISGPDWLNSERYDIAAKLPDGTTSEQIPQMLQSLLAERFKLTLSRETKVMAVYALVPAKGGPKLHETGKGGMSINTGSKGRHMSGNVALSALADSLSNMMDRPVVDMTDIKGTYVVEMEWAADDSSPGGKFGPPGEGKPASDAPDGPTIFTALQEKLGLKLEARKLPVEILTVEHAEKVPTEN